MKNSIITMILIVIFLFSSGVYCQGKPRGMIVFMRYPSNINHLGPYDDRSRMFLINADGTNLRLIFIGSNYFSNQGCNQINDKLYPWESACYNVYEPRFSRNDEQIIFKTRNDTIHNPEFYWRIGTDGTSPYTIREEGGVVSKGPFPKINSLSPDKKWKVWEKNGKIYITNLKTKTSKFLTQGVGSSWSHTNSRVGVFDLQKRPVEQNDLEQIHKVFAGQEVTKNNMPKFVDAYRIENWAFVIYDWPGVNSGFYGRELFVKEKWGWQYVVHIGDAPYIPVGPNFGVPLQIWQIFWEY